MPPIDPDKIATYIREVAAEKIIPRFQQLQKHEISTKSGPNDLVTIADLEAEEELTRIFKDIIPGSYVVGEEAVSKKETDMSMLATHDGFIWVIDPVDGTHNFASGDKKFATIVALVKNGQTVQGWILDIPGNRLAVAERGAGVELDGVRRTYPIVSSSLKEKRGFISQKFLPPKLREELKDILAAEFGVIQPYMCCAHEYLEILAGKASYALYSRIHPWDHLAGCLMMEESGGHIRKWDRTEYKPGDQRGGVIVAQDEVIWTTIHDLLLKRYMAAQGS